MFLWRHQVETEDLKQRNEALGAQVAEKTAEYDAFVEACAAKTKDVEARLREGCADREAGAKAEWDKERAYLKDLLESDTSELKGQLGEHDAQPVPPPHPKNPTNQKSR